MKTDDQLKISQNMYSMTNNDQFEDNDPNENIIARHFNRKFTNELFNFSPIYIATTTSTIRPKSKQLVQNSDLQSTGVLIKSDSIDQNTIDQKYEHEHDQEHEHENEHESHLFDVKNQIEEANLKENQNYQISSHYQIDLEEFISNKNDKIRDLISDCELINNNNINNFVNGYNLDGDTETVKSCSSMKIVSSNECHCKCHCSGGHKKKNPFHQIIKTNKLILSSLSKLKLHGSGSQKSVDQCGGVCGGGDKRSDSTEDYNYSLSSSSSISSQTISASSCSSVQDNNYNLNSIRSSISIKPTRKPPLPPQQPFNQLSMQNRLPIKPPAELPPIKNSNVSTQSNGSNDHLTNSSHSLLTKSSQENCRSSLRSSRTLSPLAHITKPYEQVITKSLENLPDIQIDRNLKPQQNEESIYETIDSDYDDDDDDYERCLNNNEIKSDDEDLYQDIELLDEEDIYETLTNEFNKSLDLLTDIKDLPLPDEAIYMNNTVNNQTELDRKLMKQQKVLDKKRRSQAQKLYKKFGLTGREIPLMCGVCKTNVKGSGLHLTLHKDEVVLVLRIDQNPPGLWLAKNERGKIGFIDLNSIDVDLEVLKNLMNEPSVLEN